MIEKALVFVPHPDDEINIAGQIIYILSQKKTTVKVCFMTNGDYKLCGGERIKEAEKSLGILGVHSDSVLLLGYGDSLVDNKHIYNLDENEVISSSIGIDKTYGSEHIYDYSFIKIGRHNQYCRKNIKEDIKGIIRDEKADLLICVDFDSHPDHRALSLLFEESLGEILKENPLYEPTVLKKFAYGGVYSGVNDYYDHYPIGPTDYPIKTRRLDSRYILDNPYYTWDERIRIKSPLKCVTKFMVSNILFKAASKHKSQDIKRRVGAICNSDVIYWQRRTDNLLKYARISASSGNVEYLNDFKLFDCSDIRIGFDGMAIMDKGFWRPSADDKKNEILIQFDKTHEVKAIVIYQDVFHNNGILDLNIICRNTEVFSHSIAVKEKITILFEQEVNTDSILIQIKEYKGKEIGIGEIEVFSTKNTGISSSFEMEEQNDYPKRNMTILDLLDRKVANQMIINYRIDKRMIEIDSVNCDLIRRFFASRGWERILINGYGKKGYKLSKLLNDYIVACIDKRGNLIKCDYPVYESILDIDATIYDVIVTTIEVNKKEMESLNANMREKKPIIFFADIMKYINEYEPNHE